ncbi:MAG: cation:proton antiporter [Fusobacteriaceae bacterium]|nr:cation:proton antiporter [Fusobacteriaceae bacterium]
MNSNNIVLENVELTRFFLAVVLLLFFSHTLGYIFSKYKMPKVIGEICGGLILGPTLLGYFLPDVYKWIFEAFESEGKLLSSIYWLGLIFLMFISGFEIQSSFSKHDKKIVSAILIGATIIPFLAGWMAPRFYDFTPFIGPKQNLLALNIVIAIAIAVTSIPVISKIFIDLDIIDSRFAKIVLAAATIQDIILWIALAIATGLVSKEHVSKINILSTVMVTIIFFLIMLFVMPKIISFISKSKTNLLMKSSLDGYVLLLCILFATIASILNINVVFGAFLVGIILGNLQNKEFKQVKVNIKKFSLAFFIPIYFAIVGLKIDLINNFDIYFFIGFLLFTTLFEIIGTFTAVKLIKLDTLSSFNFAVAMNTRGGPGIVLATVAFDMGIINETFFSVLVVIAIVTSLLAGYWFKFLISKEKPLLKNGF